MSNEQESIIRKGAEKLKEKLEDIREEVLTFLDEKKHGQEEAIQALQAEEQQILKEMEALRHGEDHAPWKIQTWLKDKRESLTTNEAFRCENFDAAPIERTHLIFIDGTNNDPFMGNVKGSDESATNIYRLYRAVKQKEVNQYAAYCPGVGSQQDDSNPLRALFRQFGGKGADKIRDGAYMELVKAYHPGDKLFLFGFSRGAAIARMLANMIAKEGIAEQGIARYVEYDGFVKHQVAGQSESFIDGKILVLDTLELSGRRKDVEIELMGLWDTVSAFGDPMNQYEPFKELVIPDNVKKVFHLLAIDENRIPFEPTLIDQSENNGKVTEIWFRGVHADVGGGYADHALADVSLQFMRNRLQADYQIQLQEPRPADFTPNPLGKIHPHRKLHWPGVLSPRAIGVKGGARKPCLHHTVFDRQDDVSKHLQELRDNHQCEIEMRD